MPTSAAAVSPDRGEPSPWIVRWAMLVPAEGVVLDLACGGGRHTGFFLDRGHPVVAVDRDLSGIADLRVVPGLEAIEADLEDGRPFPLVARRFAGVVVTNYLHRPLLPELVAAVAPGGALLYETFADGNQRYGPPSNPDFLLHPGELLEAVAGELTVRAFEEVTIETPRPAVVQRIAAVREEARV
ncbi:MAG: class I SAM-dependent methyltransferase [Acidimicrobiales bacterium]